MMTTSTGQIPPTELCRGDRIQAWVGSERQYVGVVELISPELDVAWVRDVALGERKMLDLRECRLYRDHPPAGRARQGEGM
jgi:hypothetical protein